MSTHSTSPTRLHRLALVANAAFSGLMGLMGLAFPETLSAWLGDVPALAVSGFGLGLLGFGALVGHAAARRFREPLPVGLISIADLAWVGGTVLTLALWPTLFSTAGAVVMLAVAAIVGSFALLQLYGVIAQFRHVPEGSDSTHHLGIEILADAPADALWGVVSDLASVADYSEGLRSSFMLAGTHAKIGAARRCVNTSGEAWTESCTLVEPGRALTLAFDSADPDFPFPFSTMTGGWVLEPAGSATNVRLWWNVTPEPGLMGDLTVAAMAAMAPQGMRRLVANMAAEARRRHDADVSCASAAA